MSGSLHANIDDREFKEIVLKATGKTTTFLNILDENDKMYFLNHSVQNVVIDGVIQNNIYYRTWPWGIFAPMMSTIDPYTCELYLKPGDIWRYLEPETAKLWLSDLSDPLTRKNQGTLDEDSYREIKDSRLEIDELRFKVNELYQLAKS